MEPPVTSATQRIELERAYMNPPVLVFRVHEHPIIPPGRYAGHLNNGIFVPGITWQETADISDPLLAEMWLSLEARVNLIMTAERALSSYFSAGVRPIETLVERMEANQEARIARLMGEAQAIQEIARDQMPLTAQDPALIDDIHDYDYNN